MRYLLLAVVGALLLGPLGALPPLGGAPVAAGGHNGGGGGGPASGYPVWVQLGPGGELLARAVVEAGAPCPALEVEGATWPMRPREPVPPPYVGVVTVCQARLPAGTARATLEGEPLPLLGPRIETILLIGDTGCRIKTGYPDTQECLNPPGGDPRLRWPFASVAANAAAARPDLVIHAGDFVYRYSPCPDPARCGTVYGDNWPTWRADFFEPAAPLLRTAPWVILRGNHEQCRKMGRGWFYFLNPDDANLAHCDRAGAHAPDDTPTAPFTVPLPGGPTLLVLDTAIAEDDHVDERQVAIYRQQLATWQQQTGSAWLLAHKPVVGAQLTTENVAGTHLAIRTQTLAAAVAREGLPDAVQLALAGHVHLVQGLELAGAPPQLVAGNGGTILVGSPQPEQLVGVTVPRGAPPGAGLTVTRAYSLSEFGYVVLRPAEAGWTASLYHAAGPRPRIIGECTVIDRSLGCRLQPPMLAPLEAR